jgi:hypothetical protein
MPKLPSPRLRSATSATAATRVRVGHSPPAASAIESMASHTSAGLSVIPSGMTGNSSRIRSKMVPAQISTVYAMTPPSLLLGGGGMAQRFRWVALRRMLTITERVRIVSGR